MSDFGFSDFGLKFNPHSAIRIRNLTPLLPVLNNSKNQPTKNPSSAVPRDKRFLAEPAADNQNGPCYFEGRVCNGKTFTP